MDLRSNEDDRPYRRVTRTEYDEPARNGWDDDTMTTQGYYRARLQAMTQQRWFPLAAVTLGVLVFGSIIAFSYRQGAENSPNATTPLIQAEADTYKEKPKDPGGMDVPFQDAVVFDQIDNNAKASGTEKVENLLPPPEQPVDEPVAVTAEAKTTTATDKAKNDTTEPAKKTETAPPSAPKEDADKGIMVENKTTGDSVADKIAATEAAMKAKADDTTTAADKAKADTIKATETAKVEPVKADATKVETAKVETTEVKPVPEAVVAKAETPAPKTIPMKAAETKPAVTSMNDVVKTASTLPSTPSKLNDVAPAAPTPAPVATSVSGGSAKVQLGAFKDEAAARSAWAQFQKQYAPHLNGVTPNYQRADLGAKGVFYRVQGVNLSSAQATAICQSINATKPGGCMIPR